MAWVQRYGSVEPSSDSARAGVGPSPRFAPELVPGGRATLVFMIFTASLLVVDYFVPLKDLFS